MMEKQETHTISVLVKNRFGVLSRIAGFFSGRGYNIASLTVHETHDPKYSKMTIVATGDASVLDVIFTKLSKLTEVVRFTHQTEETSVQREIALIKMRTPTVEIRSQLLQLVDIFKGNVVSVSRDMLAVELSGRSEHIDAFMELCRDFEIVDMARSGRVAITACNSSVESLEAAEEAAGPEFSEF